MTSRIAVPVLVLAMLQLGSATSAPESMDGYSPSHAAVEREWETKFRNLPEPGVMRDAMQRMSARPHNVGSPYDKENAEWMLAKFKEFGFDAHIETFEVLFPTPKERRVELLEPTHFVAKLQEPPLSVDPTSQQTSEQLPTYNAYSADGDVTGAAGVRELRHARRLREARPSRSVGEGCHRHRPLRRGMARHQAQGRGRARRVWAASSIPIPATMATSKAGIILRGRIVHPRACNAAA